MGAGFSLTDVDGNVYVPTTATTNSEGVIVWNELPFGTYTLTETKAPAGATLMSEPMQVEITIDNPDIFLEITDNSAVYLDAGGTGLITWVTLSSAVLAVGIAYLLENYQKKKKYMM